MKTKTFKAYSLWLIAILLIAYSLMPEATHAQTYDSVAAFTATTALLTTDIVPIQIKVSNKYTWRKITGLSLWGLMRDTTQAQLTTFLTDANTWSGVQTFSARPVLTGATFSAGSWGAVTVADSFITTGRTEVSYMMPYSALSFIGDAADPFLRMYSKNFVLVNSAGTDSAVISISDGDGSLIIPNLTISETVTIDSGASFNVFSFTAHDYTIPNTGDTIITLGSADKRSFLVLDLPGNITPGISKLNVEKASLGMVVRMVNNEASYSIILKDFVGNDDNLYLSADFTMGTYDYIELMCIDDASDAQKWVECSRSNN